MFCPGSCTLLLIGLRSLGLIVSLCEIWLNASLADITTVITFDECARVCPSVFEGPSVSECPRVCPSVSWCVRRSECLRMCPSVPECVRVSPSKSECVLVCPGVTECVRVSLSVPECARMCAMLSDCVRIHPRWLFRHWRLSI